MIQDPQRADPRAEDPSEDQRDPHDEQSQDQSPEQDLAGQRGAQGHQGIPFQKQRNPVCLDRSVARQIEQGKKEPDEEDLIDPSDISPAQ